MVLHDRTTILYETMQREYHYKRIPLERLQPAGQGHTDFGSLVADIFAVDVEEDDLPKYKKLTSAFEDFMDMVRDV